MRWSRTVVLNQVVLLAAITAGFFSHAFLSALVFIVPLCVANIVVSLFDDAKRDY